MLNVEQSDPYCIANNTDLGNYNLKAGNTKRKWKLCISCHGLKLVLLLFLVKNPQKYMNIGLARSSWIQRWADKIELPALQVTPWCPPSAHHASTSLRDCENQHLICLEILQTSKRWQTDPYLTLTLKDTDTQAVRCLQNALKFLHHLNYGEKLMMGHSTWAPCTHKTGQAEASRASPTGTQWCSAPYTQHITKEFCSHRSHWCRTEFSATSLSHSKEPLS